jgi:eukaryotic-like serine/threonine-protein kinase
VKVLDFGIARIAQPDPKRDSTKLTQVGMVMGTVAYMSPEQATGQAVDERADLYSLGVMLYEMIAGHVPFDAELPSQVLARQLVEEPPPLPESTPPALARLVLDLMQKKPEDRPASAQEVLERLAELTATPSGRVLAPPEPPRALLYAIAGGIAVIGALAFALSGKKAEPAAASAEPSASAAPSALASGEGSIAPVETPPAPLPVASIAPPSPSLSPSAASSSGSESTKAARSAGKSSAKPAGTVTKVKDKPASPPPPENAPKRHTGPGGIYIPPPSEWFK